MKNNIEKDNNFISVVVYMRNCEGTIESFIKTVDTILSAAFKSYEFILVDDCSNDCSINKVNELTGSITGNISLIKMSYYHGLESSLCAGVDFAIGDFVYEFDTTCINYDASLILQAYNTALTGYDVVAASDCHRSRSTSTLFYTLLSRVSYKKMKLTSETFRLVSRRAINRTTKNENRLEYRKALYHYSGLESKILYYEPINNIIPKNKLSFRQRRNLAYDVLINHSDIGIRIAGFISIIFLLFAIVAVVYTIVMYLTLESIQPGWATTMFFLSVSFGGLFFILFVISKYLTNILIEVRKAPLYVYKSIERLTKK